MNIPSKYLENAVDQLSSLPGIGKKTALRLALNLLKRDPKDIERFASAILEMKSKVMRCKKCFNISDLEICSICSNLNREETIICIVEDFRDVMAIENTDQYKGFYHVLGGIISPMEGIGPEDLNIQPLLERVKEGTVKEIIFALSATMEGDTTGFYLFRKLSEFDIKVSSIARGVSIGDEIEYADEVTLGRSIVNRTPYENSLNH